MNIRLKPLLGTALLAGAALTTASALAGDLQVTVTTPDGKPAPDVVVALLPTGATAVPAAPAAGPVLIVQREIRFEPIPKTSTGKIQKFQLRERARSSSAIE